MTEPLAAARKLIRDRLVRDALPSAAVAVAQGGRILWEEGFGWADRERRLPATPHTLYSLASISKPITATAVMLLVERGLLDLDRPVNDYLGDAPVTARAGDAADATVRRVANHTSGLPLHYQFFPIDEPCRRPPMEETIRRYGHLLSAPGERYLYSNLGYGILDHLIARLSGKSYATFMREEVFLPLGMTRASVDVGPGLEPYQAARYGPDGLPVPFYDFDHPGGSAVYCSAHDLVRFGMFHLKDRQEDQRPVLSGESVDAMQLPTAAAGEHAGYGVGWRVGRDYEGFRVVSHSGGMLGVNTTLELYPEHDLAIAVLCNAGTDLPFRAAEEIAAALLPGFAPALAAARARREEEKARPPEPFRPPPELSGEWSGQVHTHEGLREAVVRFREGGDVHVRVGGGLTALLNEPRFRDGRLTGRFAGDVGTADAARRPYHLHLDLALRGEALNGALAAISLPGSRPGNALCHWMEVRRQG